MSTSSVQIHGSRLLFISLKSKHFHMQRMRLTAKTSAHLHHPQVVNNNQCKKGQFISKFITPYVGLNCPSLLPLGKQTFFSSSRSTSTANHIIIHKPQQNQKHILSYPCGSTNGANSRFIPKPKGVANEEKKKKNNISNECV